MQAYETRVHIGPDGILRLELPVAESETDCDVVVLIGKPQQAKDAQETYGTCAGLRLEEPVTMRKSARL